MGARERQREPEGGTLARAALHAGLTAVPLDETLADEEAEAQPDAILAPRLRAGDTVEALPDAILLLQGNARPLVADRHARLPVRLAHRHPDRLLGRRVAEGIGQVIRHYLADAQRIGLNRHGRFGQVQFN